MSFLIWSSYTRPITRPLNKIDVSPHGSRAMGLGQVAGLLSTIWLLCWHLKDAREKAKLFHYQSIFSLFPYPK